MKRFAVGGAILSATPSIFLLYDGTDNPNYFNQDGTTNPTADCWLNKLLLTADGTCKIEVGLAKHDKTAFTPAFTALIGAGGPAVIDLATILARLTFSVAPNNELAVRISVTTNATVNAAGAVEFGRV